MRRKTILLWSIVTGVLLVGRVALWYQDVQRKSLAAEGVASLSSTSESVRSTIPPHGSVLSPSQDHVSTTIAKPSSQASEIAVGPCVGSDEWCSIDMPPQSLFRFPPPTDLSRWRRAQKQAIAKEPALLRHVIKHFGSPLDYLDGDVWFRQWHRVADSFIDHQLEMTMLTAAGRKIKSEKEELLYRQERNMDPHVASQYKWTAKEPHNVITPAVDLHTLSRVPIVQLGYHVFSRNSNRPTSLFGGPAIAEAIIDRNTFLNMYDRFKSRIDTPWIAMHSANENWGFLSTYLPDRSVDWGFCCSGRELKLLNEFLEDNRTVMFLVNQHLNMSHPKLLSLPRGIPLHVDGTNRNMFNAQHQLVNTGEKTSLLFTASSNWGPRPQISKCIAQRFVNETSVHFQSYGDNLSGRLTQSQYYNRLGSAFFSVALPGLGYDTHRLWESMLLGTIPIVERGVGFDKMLWRLPVLLIDDFADLTPSLLRQAYLEALYRQEDFEYNRLTQSFWFSFIFNVSKAGNVHAMQSTFPLESEVTDFTRPLKIFDCGIKGEHCGKGTKRTPRVRC